MVHRSHVAFDLASLLLGACTSGSSAGSADASVPSDAPAPSDARAPSDAADVVAAAPDSLRGNRYCELIIVYVKDGLVDANVWGTQGLNACPEADWAGIDAGAIQAALGATTVVRNGPRYWLLDTVSAELPEGEPRLFGTLEMQRLATINGQIGDLKAAPYTERTINRDSEFQFFAGTDVFELVGPDGAVYVMQSYSRFVDAALTEADLSGLGSRLERPAGWQYRSRTLDAPLVVRTPGKATVVQDELQNTYSRVVTGAE